jgi:heme-degrading monooxygenase HmoA
MVKPGMDNEFVKEWTHFAEWSGKQFPGAGKAFLLRDERNPLRFISFGPWDHEESVQNWRNTDAFRDFASRIKNLCDDFQPNMLRVASASE